MLNVLLTRIGILSIYQKKKDKHRIFWICDFDLGQDQELNERGLN